MGGGGPGGGKGGLSEVYRTQSDTLGMVMYDSGNIHARKSFI